MLELEWLAIPEGLRDDPIHPDAVIRVNALNKGQV